MARPLLRSLIATAVVVTFGLPTLAIGYMAVTGPLWLMPAFSRATSLSSVASELGVLALCVLAIFGAVVYWLASLKVVRGQPPHHLATLALAVVGLSLGPFLWLSHAKAGLGLSLLFSLPALSLLGVAYRAHSRGKASDGRG
jgi:hypothetical protein